MSGTSGNDSINGGFGNDNIDALGGNDTVNGLSGNDVIYGGTGADALSGDGTGYTTGTMSGSQLQDILVLTGVANADPVVSN